MNYRKKMAFDKRQEANEMATNRPHPEHQSNSDENKFRHNEETAEVHQQYCEKVDVKNKLTYLMSFTKGMPHNEETGLLEDPDNFQKFVKAIDSGDPRDFRDVPLGHKNHVGNKACEYPEVNVPNEPEVLPNKKPKDAIPYVDRFKWKSEKIDLLLKKGVEVKLRAWESQSAGNAFELQGPDPQAVTMPPAPKLGSEELTAEMAEVYSQAILRDVPFTAFTQGANVDAIKPKKGISTEDVNTILQTSTSDVSKVNDLAKKLSKLKWFSHIELDKLSIEEKARNRKFIQTPGNAFRGITNGDKIGPYISQFLLVGNKGRNGILEKTMRVYNETTKKWDTKKPEFELNPRDGLITYGAMSADQRVRTAAKGKNYMMDWNEWLDVQNGANLTGFEEYDNNETKRRFIHTPRDLATYVHYDALYQAYLNACLILLANKVPFDAGIPYQQPDNIDHQQGFAHFGGPHILSLVTEVATRALKAVRFQKFNIHRRCRPEVLAARIEKIDKLKSSAPELDIMFNDLKKSGILSSVKNFKDGGKNYLLPMAFCEGSPMHPAYGAGHATVAGACVTILKAFFDHSYHLKIVPKNEITDELINNIKKLGFNQEIDASNLAYVSTNNGDSLEIVPVLDDKCKLTKLTVEGELNKLASNISIGRNWAGVHYFTDYYESLLMGEEIAIGILEEQKLMFNENFSMTLPKFNGETIRI